MQHLSLFFPHRMLRFQYAITLLAFAFSGISLQAQSHAFASFSAGTVTSGTSGVSTALSTGGVTGDYLFYTITANYVGTGNVAWSNSMQVELSDGGTTIYKNLSLALTGAMGNPNSTTLTWTGVLNETYSGGGPLTVRFYDNYHDGSGPYTSNVTNVEVSIYPANGANAFPAYSAGTLTSGTSGVSTALSTGSISGDYLFYVITADFVGTGNVAWSNSINVELNDAGSTIYKNISHAQAGAMNNPNSTTLVWTGVMNELYTGGGNLTVRFFDDFHDGSGPYTSSITNVNVTLYQATSPSAFATFSPGTLTSGTSGVSTALSAGGLSGDYLFYTIAADFIGTGNVAWSNSINAELNDGGSTLYKNISHAQAGAMNNPNSTTLIWTGVMNKVYIGGGGLTVRFFDDFHDGSGPYTSSITNVNVTIYQVDVLLPIELLSFEAKYEPANQAVMLQWATGREVNNARFEVERSVDREAWETISSVPGKGTTTSVQTYQAQDFSPLTGTSYYRLKQTDHDGGVTFSNIQTIRQLAMGRVLGYPNPTQGVFVLNFATDGTSSHRIKLINSQGKVMQDFRSAESEVRLDLSAEAAGCYFVVVDNGERIPVIKN